MSDVTGRALEGLRVVEHSRGVMGAFAGKLFADLGALVTRVEPAGGRSIQNEPPFVDTAKGPASLLALHLDAAKASASLADIESLLEDADVLVDDTWPRPDAIDVPAIRLAHPGLVIAGLSPFGRTGPKAAWVGGELIGMAAGGIAHVTGRAGREPLKLAGHPFECFAGAFGVIGALAALRERETSGVGRLVDVSLAECVASNQEFTSIYTFLGIARERSELPVPFTFGHRILPCADGYLNFGTPTVRVAESLALWLGNESIRDDPRFVNQLEMGVHHRELDPIVRAGIGDRTRDEVFEFGMALRCLSGPVATPGEVSANPQLAARGYWRVLGLTGGRGIAAPGPPVRIDSVDLVDSDEGPARDKRAAGKPLTASSGNRPLAGIRVIDFTLAYAGPTGGKILAELGADVIRVSSIQYPGRGAEIPLWPDNDPGPDPWNRNGYYTDRYLGKREVTLDLTQPRGRELFFELLQTADILIENHSPRALNNLDLSYPRVAERCPHVVMVSVSAFGQQGPWANYGGMGDTVEALCGMSDATGYGGGPPERAGMTYLDPISGTFGVVGALAGLALRDRTGRGCYVDNSMLEAGVATLPEVALAAAAGVAGPGRAGNQHSVFAPHNTYRCRDGRWIAIAAMSDAEYNVLARLLDLPAGARFGDAAGRTRNREEVDSLIAARAEEDAEPLAERLQAARVQAAAVADTRDTLVDAHFRARALWQEVDHPDFGPRAWLRQFPGTIEGCDLSIPRRTPLLGEHNREILQGELGVTDEEFAALEAAEVIGTVPVAEYHPPGLEMDRLDQYEGMQNFDAEYRTRQRSGSRDGMPG